MDSIERYIKEAGGLKQFWELAERRETEQLRLQEKRRLKQEQITRGLAA